MKVTNAGMMNVMNARCILQLVHLRNAPTMSDFIPVCKTSDIPDPGKDGRRGRRAVRRGVSLDGACYAIDDCCTHDGGPLGQGRIDGFHIICPRHGARFDIRTGRALTMPAVHATPAHEVKVDGDQVLVKLKRRIGEWDRLVSEAADVANSNTQCRCTHRLPMPLQPGPCP